MNQTFFSFLTGLFYTLLLFCLCLFTVFGVKTVFIFMHDKLFPKNSSQKLSAHAEQTPRRKRGYKKPATKKVSPVRSIEINPEEIDRIYVKKIS